MIGKLQRVELREVWKHEALDFTRWLEENPDELSETLGIPLSDVQREKTAGSFSVDLVATDGSGNPVIVENQLAKSDHDHLGKLLTYLASMEAKTAVWIVAEPRPEHVTAISWLNDSSSASFYLLKVEAVKIGDSPPAPLLTVIVAPGSESKDISRTKQERAEQSNSRYRFWSQLLEKERSKTNLHSSISPQTYEWIGAREGPLGWNFVIGKRARVEVYIDRGNGLENKAIFDALFAKKGEVEALFGGTLEWQRLDDKRASRIAKQITEGGIQDEDKWGSIQDAMIDSMIRLEEALRPHLRGLPW